MVPDPRKSLGAHVHAKATAVMHESSAQRRFGSVWKTHTVPGIVEAINVRPGTGKSNRKTTYITARFFLGDSNKEKAVHAQEINSNDVVVKELLLGNIKQGFPPSATSIPTAFLSAQSCANTLATPAKQKKTAPRQSSKKKAVGNPKLHPTSAAGNSSLAAATPTILKPSLIVDERSFADVVRTPSTTKKALVSVKHALPMQKVSFETPTKTSEANATNADAVKLIRNIVNAEQSRKDMSSVNSSFLNKLVSALQIKEARVEQDINDNEDPAYNSETDELPTPYKSTRKYRDESETQDDESSSNINTTEEANDEEEEDASCVAESHGIQWYRDRDNVTKLGMGKSLARHQWRLKSQFDPLLSITDGSNADMTLEPFDIFMMLLPNELLEATVRYTNERLSKLPHPRGPTTQGELLKFFGVLILGSFVDFDDRKNLWSKKSDNKYIHAPNFGKTGMSRDRFLTLFVNIRYSHQPENQPTGMSSETYRWLLVDDHVEAFNNHRANFYNPSVKMIADELFSRWYGLGGHYINVGLPMYVAYDRKPEDGCEVQCSADGETGVMCRLKLVKSAEEDDRLKAIYPMPWYKDEIHHGGQVLLDLFQPWLGTNRLLGGDSYFASVAVAHELEKAYNMGFIGTIKTATKGFPQSYLSNVVSTGEKGDSEVLVRRNELGQPWMMAVMTVDRNRNYYVATRGSTASAPVNRIRWTQPKDDKEADAERLHIDFERPEVVNLFHSFASMIDQHNACRQEMLKFETTWKTQNWHIRCNMTLMALNIVDAWYVYKASTGVDWKQRKFYSMLCEQLIDNNWDKKPGALYKESGAREVAKAKVNKWMLDGNDEQENETQRPLRSGPHLTPVKDKNPNTGWTVQNRCRTVGCRAQVTHECSICFHLFCSKRGARFFCCRPDKSDHWEQHMKEFHGIGLKSIDEAYDLP